MSSSQPGININTNTRSFAEKFNRAAPKLKVRRQRVDSNIEIGPAHSDIKMTRLCSVDFGKASIRNTDAMFGPKDRDLNIELGEPNKFPASNKGISMSD